jgi:hypothetical protein
MRHRHHTSVSGPATSSSQLGKQLSDFTYTFMGLRGRGRPEGMEGLLS